MKELRSIIAACVVTPLCISSCALGADIYATAFDNYGTGTLSGQQAWIGTGGTWAVSGTVNSPQIAANVIGPGVDPGIAPFGGKGRMVRLCTERFANGRTKAWLDLANSGKWAAASAGGNDVLETSVRLFIPSGQALTSAFGIMISRNAIETSGGFLVSAQTGAISLLNGGIASANRTATGATASFNAWNQFVYRWDVATGRGELLVNGASVATHTTTGFGSVYAANLIATTDATPGALNAFGYFEDLAMAAVPAVAPCPGDFNGDRLRDAADLAALLGAWGSAGGDLNGDGTTDAADLAAFLGGWGACP